MTTLRRQLRLPAALVLLSAVPAIAGVVRTSQLAAGAEVTEANARFFAAPLPILLHIVGATAYCIVGAFQFAPALRVHGWHRWAGRVLVPCGLVAALSALWMTLFYPSQPGEGELLVAFRLLFGGLMVAVLVLGVAAIRRRDVATHRAWMVRAYAVAAGAGTQAVVLTGWTLAVDVPGETATAVLMAAAWTLNLAVAEWFIRRPAARPASRPVPAASA